MPLLFIKKTRNKGQAMLIALIFFITASLAVVLAVSVPIIKHIYISKSFFDSRTSFYAASALAEDLTYRYKNLMSVNLSSSLTLNNATAYATTSDTAGGKFLDIIGNANSAIRKQQMKLVLGRGASFRYGVQSGVGGVVLLNSASIQGSLLSNGNILGANSNVIGGSVIAAGPTGTIDGVHSTSTAYAHTIKNSNIDGDAYYQTISNSVVLGALHPGSVDQSTTSMPLSDADIAGWESDATSTVISSPCPYVISSSATLGPAKITCDLEVRGNSTVLTLLGPVWVTGNIAFKNGPLIKADISLGARSVAMIADNPADHTTSSKITLPNTTTFENSGNADSFVMLLSQNNGAENGTGDLAIEATQTAIGALLLYAGHGEISLSQNTNLKEVSSYKLTLKNTTNVVYDTGVINLLFTAGPGGTFDISGWKETQ